MDILAGQEKLQHIKHILRLAIAAAQLLRIAVLNLWIVTYLANLYIQTYLYYSS